MDLHQLIQESTALYQVIEVSWSQTDKDTYIVKADSEAEAIKAVKAKMSGARYVNVIRNNVRML